MTQTVNNGLLKEVELLLDHKGTLEETDYAEERLTSNIEGVKNIRLGVKSLSGKRSVYVKLYSPVQLPTDIIVRGEVMGVIEIHSRHYKR